MKPGSGANSDRPPVSFNRALGWSYVMEGGQYATTTVITFVLAAILGPSIFGLVAMALVYLTFIQMLLRQGMVPALVQRRDLEESHLNSAFWLVMASGAVLTATSVLLSHWWAEVNRTPELEVVINVMSVIVPLQALVVVQEALLSRHMDFKGLALRTNSAALFGGVVGLVMALTGFGVWALVAQHIGKSVVDLVAIWMLSDWRPRASFSWTAAREILGYSSGTAIAGLGSFLSSRSDALLIGLFFGPTAVGLYRLAARLVEIVTYVTTSAFQAVSLPELSRLQDDPKLFQNRATRMVGLASLLAIPSLGILSGSSEVLMNLMGADWEAAAVPLSVLCVAGAVLAITLFSGPILLSVGRPRVFALITWLSAVASGGSFVLAGVLLSDASIDDQVLGVALMRLGVFSTVVLAIAGWAIVRYSTLTVAPLVHAVRPAVLGGLVGAASTFLLNAISWTGTDLGQLAFVVIPSVILTASFMWWIEPTVRRVLKRGAQTVRRAWPV